MDIVERLRSLHAEDDWKIYDQVVAEAADEIARLREALKLVRDELDRRRKNAEEARKEKE